MTRWSLWPAPTHVTIRPTPGQLCPHCTLARASSKIHYMACCIPPPAGARDACNTAFRVSPKTQRHREREREREREAVARPIDQGTYGEGQRSTAWACHQQRIRRARKAKGEQAEQPQMLSTAGMRRTGDPEMITCCACPEDHPTQSPRPISMVVGFSSVAGVDIAMQRNDART